MINTKIYRTTKFHLQMTPMDVYFVMADVLSMLHKTFSITDFVASKWNKRTTCLRKDRSSHERFASSCDRCAKKRNMLFNLEKDQNCNKIQHNFSKQSFSSND